ncbi:FABP family protein [Euzebya sp.]|uniref:FABP family protein n=1 Tax=Euzebya sp. TaxID=1971409 RepID=UPI003513DD55
MTRIDPHPDIGPLTFLIGTWRGRGRGVYPTIDSFAYTEEVVIEPLPKPVLRYGQRTAHADTGEPLHAEAGFFRLPDGVPELVIAQPTGIVECHAGVLEGQRLVLQSTVVGLTPSAAGHRVTDVERTIEVVDDVLRYSLAMAAVGQDLQVHLVAELTRV